MQEEDALCEE